MPESFATIHDEARAWFERARQRGWIEPRDVERFEAVEHATPADLFVDQQTRPLVVAFFGGTGVGKSSLINRLAEEPIARTGVERPTSTTVTLYLHRSIELASLPKELPLDEVDVKRHDNEQHRHILWVDAPDIDSTTETNRQCALAWLPHIDLVTYVVSPERYRDDAGWRVLLERGHKHGWMFVMNHWDEGDPTQTKDFEQMLRGAGFENPILLRTTCVEPQHALASPDQFDQLETMLEHLLAAHGVRELGRLGHRARLDELNAAIRQTLPRFGDTSTWTTMIDEAELRWQQTADAILQGSDWTMQAIAGRLAVREQGLLGKVWQQVALLRGSQPKSDDGPDPTALVGVTDALWDDWPQTRLESCLDGVELHLRHAALASQPARRQLDQVRGGAQQDVLQGIHEHVRAAIAQPGTAWERVLRRITGFLTAMLPTLAVAWVGYEVVVGYYRATKGETAFFGSAFAIHSALLVLIAWALPFMADRLVQPPLQKVILRAMQQAMRNALEVLGERIVGALGQAADEALKLRSRGEQLMHETQRVASRPVDADHPALGRLVPRQVQRDSKKSAPMHETSSVG